MSDILALQRTLPITHFPPTSRYAAVKTATYTSPDGEPTPYLQRRFLPPVANFFVMSEYAVQQGERLDQIAARALGDSELFWRICDANRALDPFELTQTIGRRLLITLPEGVPGLHG